MTSTTSSTVPALPSFPSRSTSDSSISSSSTAAAAAMITEVGGRGSSSSAVSGWGTNGRRYSNGARRQQPQQPQLIRAAVDSAADAERRKGGAAPTAAAAASAGAAASSRNGPPPAPTVVADTSSNAAAAAAAGANTATASAAKGMVHKPPPVRQRQRGGGRVDEDGAAAETAATGTHNDFGTEQQRGAGRWGSDAARDRDRLSATGSSNKKRAEEYSSSSGMQQHEAASVSEARRDADTYVTTSSSVSAASACGDGGGDGEDNIFRCMGFAHDREVELLGVDDITALAMYKDRVLIAAQDGYIRAYTYKTLFGTRRGQRPAASSVVEASTLPLCSMAPLRDAELVAVGGFDGSVVVTTLNGGRKHRSVSHADAVCCLGGGLGGELVSGSTDQTVRRWSLTPSGLVSTVAFDDHCDDISAVAMHRNVVVSGAVDGKVIMWDARSASTPIWTTSIPHSQPIVMCSLREERVVLVSSGYHAVVATVDLRMASSNSGVGYPFGDHPAGGGSVPVRQVANYDVSSQAGDIRVSAASFDADRYVFLIGSQSTAAGLENGFMKVIDVDTGLEAGHWSLLRDPSSLALFEPAVSGGAHSSLTHRRSAGVDPTLPVGCAVERTTGRLRFLTRSEI
eukprot:GHVU01013257.1.p1 GENE.GHVU01013257.1~~GHVU01013257.1.p1  ORF type:complete len:627 (+),score=82.35 GHVU01013257.1:3-1883(+)